MKNVAGYDVPKLLIGSWGTLGVILEVTFRLFPFPPTQLLTGSIKPFVMREIHRKIKSAFDPNWILMPKLARISKEDLQEAEPEDPAKPPSDFDRYEKNFWS